MLSSIPAPSGNEEILKKFIKKKLTAEYYEDSIGNLIVNKNGGGERVVLMCAVDEDAVILLQKDNEKVYFNHIGEKELYPGTEISVSGTQGYICCADSSKPLENQYIEFFEEFDFEPGEAGIVSSEYYEDENFLKGSRIGKLAVITELINTANTYKGEKDLFVVFEVQSLFGHKGGIVACNEINPDVLWSFEEIENKSKELLGIKSAKNYVSNRLTDEIYENIGLKPYVDTKLSTIAIYVKNCLTGIVGIPVKFTQNPSQYVSKETTEKIKEFLNNILK